MQNNENKTKEELIKIIEQLEKKVEDLSSMQSYPVQERFREKYSTRILGRPARYVDSFRTTMQTLLNSPPLRRPIMWKVSMPIISPILT